MPTLDDAPKAVQAPTLALTDLAQVYDLSAQPIGSVPVTLQTLFNALALLPSSSSGLASGGLYWNSNVLTRVS